MQEIIIIAAMSKNRVIGKDNAIPWSLKEDMSHFKKLTNGWPCIMGRKTWASLPKKPLPGRLNVVISSTLTEDSSVPRIELCPQEASSVPHEQALSPRMSSVPQKQVLSPRSKLCPQEASSVPQEQALSPKTNSNWGQSSQNSSQSNSQAVIKIFPSLSSSIEYCAAYEKIFICGGETIYRQALALANKIELTIINDIYEGDTFFPEIDASCWIPVNTEDFDTFSFITYTKNK